MTDIEEALALLAAPCTDDRFFQRALKALALVTQCRWAAFGRPSADMSHIDILWFCDNKQLLPGFSFPIDHSPCEKLYRQKSATHILFARDLQKSFPEFGLVHQIGAQSYQGELILADNGEPLGHILVMDPLPQEENTKSREFFRLLAQRIGVEYRRLLVSRQLNLHKEMIRATRHMMSFVDTDYRYQVVSSGYEITFGRAASELEGKLVAELHGEETFDAHIKPLIDRALAGEVLHTQHWIYPPSPQPPVFVSVHHNPYINENGDITGVIISAHDITAIREAEAQRAYLDAHDPLTGVANRDTLIQHMEAMKQAKVPFGLIYLDISDFSSINHELGRTRADEVLTIVAKRLAGDVSGDDLVTRIAGDEFVVLVCFGSEDDAQVLQQEALISQLSHLEDRLLSRLGQPIRVDGKSYQLKAYSGACLCLNPLDSIDDELARVEKEIDLAKTSLDRQAR
ncbi:GGDEF domain-containing protein [Shewanella khirikhana]|uniref:Cyclic di-GMP phosphodiesterase Gmr n=1 Tax=Shewanella khirikhana TaxID=1965282 RepID=A0ABM7DAA4_9GAMM|nr:GGDEF domain-containing protein [Shewanella khirikhana]AZQ10784.1 Cyclic di-GMP phosphodiesterase Gmr [Shewanella khirikhana]